MSGLGLKASVTEAMAAMKAMGQWKFVRAVNSG
jgi:hypothetical protein